MQVEFADCLVQMLSEPPWSPLDSEFLTSSARLPVPHISAPFADVSFTQPANRPVGSKRVELAQPAERAMQISPALQRWVRQPMTKCWRHGASSHGGLRPCAWSRSYCPG